MIDIKKAVFTDDIVDELLYLSKLWAEEDITFGLIANTKEDLEEPCYIALDKDKVVGYIFGKYYVTEKKTSYIEIGEKCFFVDELYVLKEYRNQGIGKRLFKALGLTRESSVVQLPR